MVDSDTMLAVPVSLQRLETVRRGSPQVTQTTCRKYSLYPHTCSSLKILRQTRTVRPKKSLSASFPLNRLTNNNDTFDVNNVKGYIRLSCITPS